MISTFTVVQFFGPSWERAQKAQLGQVEETNVRIVSVQGDQSSTSTISSQGNNSQAASNNSSSAQTLLGFANEYVDF